MSRVQLIVKSIVITSFILGIFTVDSLMAVNSHFTVTSTGNDYTEIEFNLPDYMIVPVEVEGVKYNRLYHPEAGYLMDEQLPEVLTFSFFLSVPRTGIVQIEQPKIQDSQIINNFMLFPSQGYNLEIDDERGFVKDNVFYEKDVNYPEVQIQVSEPMVIRDSRLVTVTFYPFAYNPAREELTVKTRMTVRVNYDLSQQGENELRYPERRKSRGFERMKSSLFVNYDQFRNPNIEFQPRSILIIRHSSNTIDLLVNQFVEWKRDKGFEVTVTNTSGLTSVAAIKNYISNAYFNWAIPPEYIILIGDGSDGVLTIPHQSGDHTYSLLEGNDNLADVFVGRLSVPNQTGLATAWNKIRNYERTPYMTETQWYNRSTLIADLFSHSPTIPNASPLFMIKYIKEMMLTYKNDYNITEIYSAPFPTQMEQAMNQGNLFFWYRGAIGGSGWVASESLTNGYRLPHANYVTCSTLNYAGGAQAEPIFRVGTPLVAKGAITAIGFIGGVNTGPGNALTAGSLTALYVAGIRNMGEALVYSKNYLWSVYGNSHTSQATQHSNGGNLIGDPTLDVWLQKPKVLNAAYPQNLPLGSNSILIAVTDEDNEPIKDAWVTIRKLNANGQETMFATGYTGADGISTRFFNPDNEGEVRVTVTKPDYIPHIGTFNLTGTPAVSFHDRVINGELNAGNQVNFVIIAKNHRTLVVNGVNGTITSSSPYVNIVTANSAYGNIAANSTAQSSTNYTIQIAPHTPANHNIVFNLALTDNAQNTWTSRFMLTIKNGNLIPTNFNVLDNGNGVLDPLEEADLRFHIRNTGQNAIPNVMGRLNGSAYGMTVIDADAAFGNIAPGQTVSSTTNHIRVSTSTYVIPGQIFDFELELYNNEGFNQKHIIKLPIGTVTVNTPLGPDAYGYWIYDHGDVGYVDSPQYEWVEIALGQGGFDGTNLNIAADYDNVQGFRTIDLPFTFRFYGVEYDEVTVCANGWISFGRTAQGEQRNWRLPGVLGPRPIVAAFWDNLSLSHGGIYTYFNEETSQFIIQWHNTRNVIGDAINTFQIILYDPNAYYTTTFDGPVKIQYRIFNNVNNGANSPSGIGNWGNYCTVGIRNHLNTIGLEYTFNNRYPTAARTITNNTALYITTGLSSALVAIENYSITDGNNNIPEYGETVSLNMTLRNVGIEGAENVVTQISTQDPYITILQNSAVFGDMDIDEAIERESAYTIQIADNIPHNHRPSFKIDIHAEDHLFWNYHFSFPVSAPSLTTTPPFVYDPAPGGNNNGLIDPGEQVIMYLPIKNLGAKSPPVSVTVTSESDLATVTGISDHQLSFIGYNETQYPAVFLNISNQAGTGSGIRFSYSFDAGNYQFEGQFLIGVGGIVPVTMGTGEAITSTNGASPINIYFRSNRSQFVYTVQEFNAEGIYGEFPINQFGFYIHGAPAHPLVNFVIRMRHTNAGNAAEHNGNELQTVYSRNSYAPAAGDWHLLTLDTPFIWNGVDNLLVDTAFAPVQGWSSTGQIRVYPVENGYRFTRADSPDQTSLVTNTVSNDKPQAMLMMGVDPDAAANRPRNLTAESTAASINLSWQPPNDNRNNGNSRRGATTDRDQITFRNTRYNVYRNGILLNEQPILETTYQDPNIEGYVTYHYYVTAVIDGTESYPSNVVSLEANATARPEMTPPAGIYAEPIMITLSSTSDNSIIRYTLDGSEPNEDSHLYEEPFEIIYHTVVKAKAYKEGWLDSRISEAEYHILYAPHTFEGRGTVGVVNSIRLTWLEPWKPEENLLINSKKQRVINESRDGLIHRTVLGYNVYRQNDDEQFEKLNEEMIEGFLYNDRGMGIGIYNYYVTAIHDLGESAPSDIIPVGVGVVTKPIFSHQAGVYDEPIRLNMSNTTNDTVILYTLNGEDPTENSAVYTRPPILIDRTTEVRAFSIRTDWQDSEIIRAVFVINNTSVNENEEMPTLTTELLAAYPNPFNPSTTISFTLKDVDNVTLEVYNILGQKITTLVNEMMPSGSHNVVWNGNDSYGKRVSSGIYFFRMKTSDYSSVRKAIMLK